MKMSRQARAAERQPVHRLGDHLFAEVLEGQGAEEHDPAHDPGHGHEPHGDDGAERLAAVGEQHDQRKRQQRRKRD
jgi:hypothetical protein